ncbi:MAG: hypothetical protein ACR2F8_02175 [Caulobacteraceae bacterium]
MVELVHRDHAVVERLDPQLVHREAEGGVGADQHLVVAGQELADRLDLGFRDARLVDARRVAQVPLRLDRPIPMEAEPRQRLVGEAAADGAFGDHDDRLGDALVVQLVERDEHQGARLAGRRRRLDQQIPLAAPLKGALLHGAHAHLVGPGRGAGPAGAQ